MDGWIKFHRKLLDNPIIMKDKDYFAIWGYLLLNATHKEYDVLFKGKRITLKEGQLITGRKKIAQLLKIDENKVQRILKSFENEQQIEQQTTSQNRLISIINWHEYQESEQQNEQQMNNERTTSEQRVNTNKNVKNIKNEKNNSKCKFVPPSFDDVQKYISEKKLNISAQQFLDYYTEGNWIDAKGNKVKNWKQKALTWNKYGNNSNLKKVDVKEFEKSSTENWDDLYDN